jgi:hypothetical protein
VDEWRDNRSRPIGQIAGNVVLRDLEQAGDPIRRDVGTTFASDVTVYVCRTSRRSYLRSPELHWCNLSRRQQRREADAARRRGQALAYVFITVTPSEQFTIDYWTVPGDLMGRVLAELPVKRSKQSCVRVFDVDGTHRIGEYDVTPFHHVAALTRRDRMLLKRAQLGDTQGVRAPMRPAPPAHAENQPMIVQIIRGAQRFVGVARLATDGD